MSLPAGVTLKIETTDYTDDVTGLVHSTETNGGYKQASFTLCAPQGPAIHWDDVVTIYDSTYNFYPFIGHVQTVHKVGLNFEITAVRSTRLQVYRKTTGPMTPSHPSGEYSGKIYHAGTPIVTALQDALQLCERVFDGGITDPGLQFVADSNNLGGDNPEQIWDYISSLTNSLATPLLWHIRGTAGLQVVNIAFADLAGRYYVELSEDSIDENYDSDIVITRSTVEWGNDQVADIDENPSVAGRKLIHDRYVNGSNNLTRVGDAQDLADSYLARFGQFTSSNDSLSLKCERDTVRIVPPLVIAPNDNWPLHLIESGHGLVLLNRPTSLAPYNQGLKFIVGTEYHWDTGELTISCGHVTNFGTQVQKVVDYNVNRLFFGPYTGPTSQPLANADLIPTVGPELKGDVPPSFSSGIPTMVAPITTGDPNVPYDKQIHPDLVPDEGLEANFNIPINSAGFQGAIRITPGHFNEYEILIMDTTGQISDTVTIDLYKRLTDTTRQFLFSITVVGQLSKTGPISPEITLTRKDWIMCNVTTAAGTATLGAISLHAKKHFPGLKL